MKSLASLGTTTNDISTPALSEVVKRGGRTVQYDRSRIAQAVEMAFRALCGGRFAA